MANIHIDVGPIYYAKGEEDEMVQHTTCIKTVALGEYQRYDVWLQVTLIGGTIRNILGVKVLDNFTVKVEWERKDGKDGKFTVEKPGCISVVNGPGIFFMLGLDSWLRKELPRKILMDGLGNSVQDWVEFKWRDHIRLIRKER